MILQVPNRTLKEKWLEAFKDERWLVQRDQRVGVVVSAADKNRARLAALRADGQDYKMGQFQFTVQNELILIAIWFTSYLP